MTARRASCSCGQLSLAVEGEPVRISLCHCLACQRRTGSVFGAQARFPADKVQFRGESREYVRAGDSGGQITFNFCPACGSTLYYRLKAVPDVVAVPVGAFADPAFPPPWASVYESRRHAWVRLPDGIEHID